MIYKKPEADFLFWEERKKGDDSGQLLGRIGNGGKNEKEKEEVREVAKECLTLDCIYCTRYFR